MGVRSMRGERTLAFANACALMSFEWVFMAARRIGIIHMYALRTHVVRSLWRGSPG